MATTEVDPVENVADEDEASRHRRERRELQGNIQQLKKSINKNDKTRKKKIDGEIKALEEAFAKRWEHFSENASAPTEEQISPEVCEKTHRSQSNLKLISRLNMSHAKRVVKRIKTNVKQKRLPIKK